MTDRTASPASVPVSDGAEPVSIVGLVAALTWPIVECDQNDSPHLFDIVTGEVAERMPVGTQVVIAFTDRHAIDSEHPCALAWGYAALGTVTSHEPTNNQDVVIGVSVGLADV